MDIRSVQRTGNMFYVYLPTAWCKKFNISGGSEVRVFLQSDGAIVFSPLLGEPKQKSIDLSIDEKDLEIINKIIVACYINPAASFRIHLKEKLDHAKLLHQKKLVSIELVEAEGKTITCESSVSVSEPELLLKTVLNKVKNMLLVMARSYNRELIERYEEEIDRNRLLIEKSVITALTFSAQSKTKLIHLYYISQVARSLEGLADHLLEMDRSDVRFLETVIERIDMLRELLEMAPGKGFPSKSAIEFSKLVTKMSIPKVESVAAYNKRRIKDCLEDISNVLIDWSVTDEIA